ncbi:MAG: pantetheine-phosphate adenylyltransferase [bacterium JZ-2024 1]
MKAVYPGTFDPITNGHLDIIRRALSLFDELTILVADNPDKAICSSLEERLETVRDALDECLTEHERPRVLLTGHRGLLVEFLKASGIRAVVRGLRAVSDYEYELQMAQTNRLLHAPTETVFLVASPEYSFLSSSLVRQVAALGGDIRDMVPRAVWRRFAHGSDPG